MLISRKEFDNKIKNISFRMGFLEFNSRLDIASGITAYEYKRNNLYSLKEVLDLLTEAKRDLQKISVIEISEQERIKISSRLYVLEKSFEELIYDTKHTQ